MSFKPMIGRESAVFICPFNAPTVEIPWCEVLAVSLQPARLGNTIPVYFDNPVMTGKLYPDVAHQGEAIPPMGHHEVAQAGVLELLHYNFVFSPVIYDKGLVLRT
jgi:hypothetical protein